MEFLADGDCADARLLFVVRSRVIGASLSVALGAIV